jgi:dimethylargininase
MLMALTREISPAFDRCLLTHAPRVAIDVERARAQHAAYEWALVEAGCTVRRIDAGLDLPDSVFIEDLAVLVPEGAIVTRPGASERRAEAPGVIDALARHGQPLQLIRDPGTLDGGDVLVAGRRAWVGLSSRTNRAGAEQLTRILGGVGYAVRTVPVDGCLHLKSAVTAVGDGLLLINRAFVPVDAFEGVSLIHVDPDEPQAANALAVGPLVVYPAAYPRTRKRLERHDLIVRPVDVSELQKAEGAVTCCSLVFEM